MTKREKGQKLKTGNLFRQLSNANWAVLGHATETAWDAPPAEDSYPSVRELQRKKAMRQAQKRARKKNR